MRTLFLILVLIAAIPSCEKNPQAVAPPPPPAESPADSPVTIEGKLLAGIAAIGGETTGWAIEQERPEGGVVRTEIDCAALANEADALHGKHVRAHGRWEDRRYLERGTLRVLIVEKLEEAP